MTTSKGRPSKLTPKVEKEFVDLVKSGNYIETACVMVGIGRSTYYDWIKKANDSIESNRYTKFRDNVRKAQAWAEARDIFIISRHAENNWRAAAWLLERKYPQRWGRRKPQKKRQISDKPITPVTSPVHISPEHVPPGDRVLNEQAIYYECQVSDEWEEPPEKKKIEKKIAIISTAEIEFYVKRQFYPVNPTKNLS